jgi:predicted PurR-regulated permease PerM
MNRTQLFAIFFFTVFLYLLYQFYLVFNGFIGPLSWAGILALMFYPTYRWLTALLRQRESVAAS